MKPTKQEVREWLRKEVEAKRPPPEPEQIRRELGWDLLPPDSATQADTEQQTDSP
jgi:hypothetical protein